MDSKLANVIEWVPGENRHFLGRGAWEDVRWVGGGELCRVVTLNGRDHVDYMDPRHRCRAFRNGEALEM